MFLFFPLLLSCATAGSPAKETRTEVESSLKSVAEALSGEELSDEELRGLTRDLRKDKEAQSAVQSITEAVVPVRSVKYCPVTGKRYAPSLDVCPVHEVPLQTVKE